MPLIAAEQFVVRRGSDPNFALELLVPSSVELVPRIHYTSVSFLVVLVMHDHFALWFSRKRDSPVTINGARHRLASPFPPNLRRRSGRSPALPYPADEVKAHSLYHGAASGQCIIDDHIVGLIVENELSRGVADEMC